MTTTPSTEPAAEPAPGIDPAEMAIALRVLASLSEIDPEDPDFVTVRQATAKMFKSVKMVRRGEKRQAIADADREVIAATATGARTRIDDETIGAQLRLGTDRASAGELLVPRACYICKQKYTLVDAFYHQLCPGCAAMSHQKRDARTDLTGKRALLTGGRAKIGMYIALRLLRDGAHTTITTRFPRDAVRRFSAMPDSADWLHRLRIVGIDLRDPAQVIGLADSVAAAGPLDILINNAAQTVRRSPGSYSMLALAEQSPLPEGSIPEIVTFGHANDAHPTALAASVTSHPILTAAAGATGALTADDLTALALAPGSSSLERLAAGTAIDAGGLVPDLHDANSWTANVQDVDPLEMLEVQLCNTTAPFLLVSRLRASLAASEARRTYIVNVSAMEGVFGRGYKGPGHPHTNMAKAALNMLTRTSAKEMLSDGILMTSVDTGWITDERPHPTKVRLAEEGFHAPLDLVDGAARVYDPIVRGEAGEDLCGVFLKDYQPGTW
ncbi:SDR family oxidoreductase [Cryobacterium sp. TMT1-21]|uniref:SDR family oxidoreductase n=1 Tax=Cryobacterium shii TaxID=1259235 RepID=A0AAQ2HFW6_9MICO|nr:MULTISPECIES: SDR family NAD(P)-dependent oxidoreductase [Cryobacterium]TFC49833.1 SDR family oxidoreductase [Cryobacterium shii]TFC86015.1 SDR family oxidoreductase [Cryobacterium sp. TmT2-59]TFD13756.1 SDR family oxidoreductase [Cryobacterium sp. TMT4-10]TFD16737.1 SDR family oxidoreductase [Cryobacterium sp. TMT1-21]TFD19728.1 SDR family oxidoreductase [Cryobacterium sp. TMT2-23]